MANQSAALEGYSHIPSRKDLKPRPEESKASLLGYRLRDLFTPDQRADFMEKAHTAALQEDEARTKEIAESRSSK